MLALALMLLVAVEDGLPSTPGPFDAETAPPSPAPAPQPTSTTRVAGPLLQPASGESNSAAVVLKGGLDKQAISSAVDASRSAIADCYSRALPESLNLAGKLVLAWTINSEGNVSSPTVEKNDMTTRSAPFEQCVLSTISKLRFPPPRGGGVVYVHYPFVFGTSEASPPAVDEHIPDGLVAAAVVAVVVVALAAAGAGFYLLSGQHAP